MKKTLAAVAVGLLLAACSNTDPATTGDAKPFVDSVRANNMAKPYSNEQLAIMHEQMCTLESQGNDPARVLDNYGLLTSKERQEMADVVSTTCGE